jgi:hypothetical protein
MSTHLKLVALAALAIAAFIGGAIVAMGPAKAADLSGYDFRHESADGRTTYYGNMRDDRGDYDGDRTSDRTYSERYRRDEDCSGKRSERIEADGSYDDDSLPRNVQEWRAQRIAIMSWKEKVRDRYGHDYARWRAATEKSVDCQRSRHGAVTCYVSAFPEQGRGWGGWGRGWTHDAERYGEADVN